MVVRRAGVLHQATDSASQLVAASTSSGADAGSLGEDFAMASRSAGTLPACGELTFSPYREKSELDARAESIIVSRAYTACVQRDPTHSPRHCSLAEAGILISTNRGTVDVVA